MSILNAHLFEFAKGLSLIFTKVFETIINVETGKTFINTIFLILAQNVG